MNLDAELILRGALCGAIELARTAFVRVDILDTRKLLPDFAGCRPKYGTKLLENFSAGLVHWDEVIDEVEDLLGISLDEERGLLEEVRYEARDAIAFAKYYEKEYGGVLNMDPLPGSETAKELALRREVVV